jgi:hypothetical protein
MPTLTSIYLHKLILHILPLGSGTQSRQKIEQNGNCEKEYKISRGNQNL